MTDQRARALIARYDLVDVTRCGEGWHWWKRMHMKKELITIVKVKKNWGNGKLYVYAAKRTEDCKGEWQAVQGPRE
jgi:hypothetical protein